MSLKTNFEMLLASTIVLIFMNGIYVVNGIKVYMNDNITASVGENGIQINCSYTKENVKKIFTVGLSARNKTDHKEYFAIVSFFPNDASAITPSGEYLSDRITMTNITQESTEATLILNELKCIDQNQYRCGVTYRNIYNEVKFERSLPTTIIITAKPQKPHMSSDNSQQNHNIDKRSILPGEVMNRTSIYQTTNVTDHDTSSIQIPREGDNVTLVCNGNVGRPPGKIMWQKIYMNEYISLNYDNETNQTDPLPWKCSFNRTSYLTFQLSVADFNATIRCSVVSHDGNDEMYVETAPFKFHFGVRHASINKLPDKQIFDTTIKHITLTCKADGHPKPTYTWYKRKDKNKILSTSKIYVIDNVITNNSGIYVCEVQNSFYSTNEEKYNASTSVNITIENKHDTTEHKKNKSEILSSQLKGIVIGGIASLLVFIALAIFIFKKCHAPRKRYQPTSVSGNGAKDNPGYSSTLETNLDKKDSGIRKDDVPYKYTMENKEKDKVKLKNKEIELANSTKQTNNEAASYAYVTVSSDYHAEKETKFDSYEKFKPSTINEKNISSTTASSKYAKENLNENSSDHYASSVPGEYDVLHGNRYKTDKGEAYDRMSELNRLPENGRKSNKSITNQDKTMIGSLPIHLENSRLGGYESVVIDVDKPVISSGNNEYGHADPETIRDHNTEYMHNQKQEENKMNKSPIPNHTAEYAQVNEATKIKNKTKNNDKDKDQTTVEVSARTQEGVNCNSEDRPPEIMDQFDTPNKNTGRDESESSNKSSQIERNNTQPFVNGVGKEKGKVAIVLPIIGSSVESEGDTLKENTNAEVQQEIEDRSGQRVDNAQSFGTNNQKNQQTNSDPKSSFKYNQTGSQNNQAFESEEYQHVDSVSLDSIEDNGSKQ